MIFLILTTLQTQSTGAPGSTSRVAGSVGEGAASRQSKAESNPRSATEKSSGEEDREAGGAIKGKGKGKADSTAVGKKRKGGTGKPRHYMTITERQLCYCAVVAAPSPYANKKAAKRSNESMDIDVENGSPPVLVLPEESSTELISIRFRETNVNIYAMGLQLTKKLKVLLFQLRRQMKKMAITCKATIK